MLYPLENYFSLTDILSAITWLLLLSMLVFYRASKEKSRHLSRLYVLNFYFKTLFASAFAYYYIVEFNGGDTLGYWDGAKCIQKLLMEDPLLGIEHILNEPSLASLHHYFSPATGYPPRWIFIEPESYFVCKIVAIVGIFTSQSYMAVTFVFSFLFAHANWKLFELARTTSLFKLKLLPYFALFIPSVSFWCSGISKDTLIAISMYFIIIQLYNLFILKQIHRLKYWIILLFGLYIIYHIRSFMLLPLLLPVLIAVGIHLNKKLKLSPSVQLPFNTLFIGFMIVLTVQLFSSDYGVEFIASNSLVQEAIVVQNDFQNNQAYGKNQYSLGEIDNSPLGILKAIPIAVFSGIFQPLPWNGLSISLFLNAIESAILIFILAKMFFKRELVQWFFTIRKNKLLVFCLVFVITLAFMTGFTSIIFGVLVRIRAPLLPILGMLLVIKIAEKNTSNSDKTNLKHESIV